MCYLGTAYKLWFRHTLEPEINSIPYNIRNNKLQKFTLDELRSACQKFDITHMHIDGNIPHSLDELTPHLRQLRLEYIPHRDQLQQ